MKKSLWLPTLAALAFGVAAEAAELPPKLHETALRRRSRFAQIEKLQSRGVLGEGKDGLLALRDPARADLNAFIEEENRDRETTFEEVSKMDEPTPIEETRRIFALKFKNKAPAGTPVQNQDGTWGTK